MQHKALVQVVPGLFRGVKPQSAFDFLMLKRAGVRQVLDLQSDLEYLLMADPNQEYALSKDYGLSLVQVRMSMLMAPTPDELDLALNAIKSGAPTLVHCHANVDRTGAVVAAALVKLHGWSWADAKKDLLSRGFHICRFWWWLPVLEKYCKR